MKDSVHRAINESDNLYWFCDVCRPVVNGRLASDLPADLMSPRLIESIESVVAGVVGAKLHEHSILYEASLRSFEYQLSETQTQITLLKQSNIDMVKMLSHGRSGSSLNVDQMKISDIHRPNNESQNEPGASLPRVNQRAATDATNKPARVNAVSGGQPRNKQGPLEPSTSDTSARKKQTNGSSSTIKIPTIRGSGKASDILKVAPKGRNWVWVGNFARTTTSEQILQHLSAAHPQKDFLAFDLKSKSNKKSFKVGSSDMSVEELQSPGLWPDGLLIRPFRDLQQ